VKRSRAEPLFALLLIARFISPCLTLTLDSVAWAILLYQELYRPTPGFSITPDVTIVKDNGQCSASSITLRNNQSWQRKDFQYDKEQ
jgi:hypothetical protein